MGDLSVRHPEASKSRTSNCITVTPGTTQGNCWHSHTDDLSQKRRGQQFRYTTERETVRHRWTQSHWWEARHAMGNDTRQTENTKIKQEVHMPNKGHWHDRPWQLCIAFTRFSLIGALLFFIILRDSLTLLCVCVCVLLLALCKFHSCTLMWLSHWKLWKWHEQQK